MNPGCKALLCASNREPSTREDGIVLRTRLAIVALAGAVIACLSAASPASAVFHLTKIREVHKGGAVAGDFVELQFYANGQNLLGGRSVRTYDALGNPFSTVPLSNVPIGRSQRSVLIADSVISPTPDIVDSNLNIVQNTGGAVCFLRALAPVPGSGVDCVSFGSFNGFTGGVPSPVGSPVSGTGGNNGLALNDSIHRTIARGCALGLDPADDTNNSAADFALGPPSPRNNSTRPTELACPPCGGRTATQAGTNGPDVLVGTRGPDRIAGLGGNDVIRGLGKKDVLCGGAGKDRLVGGAGNDRLVGGGGNDILRGGGGKDVLKGGRGKDRLIGQAGRDKCVGGPGKDRAKRCEVRRSI